MATLLEKANQILAQKEANLLPENLKSGVTCMGVEGTLQEGIDTSDATATANDIVSGKTAYVNGEKIEGAISVPESDVLYDTDTRIAVGPVGTADNMTSVVDLYYTLKEGESVYIPELFEIRLRVLESVVADAIGLTADKIKSGETILGITGTYTGYNTGEDNFVDDSELDMGMTEEE